MNKKLVYGGMATAMVAILASGASLYPSNGGGGVPETGLFNPAVPQPAINNMAALREAPGKISEKDANAVPETSDMAAAPSAEAKKDKLAMAEMARQMAVDKSAVGPIAAPAEQTAMADMAAPAPAARMKMESVAGGTTFNSIAMPASPPMVTGMIRADDAVMQPAYHDVGRDKFEHVEESPIKAVRAEPVSTFSIDVDTSSYSFIRKQLNAGVLPQKDAVRVEEMVNYFDYNYALPIDKAEPFKPTITVMSSPWGPGHKLVHIGIKGYDIPATEKPHSNLVFLIDTSGSMNEPDKLPLLKNSFKMLLDTLKADDSVAIVTYAGSAGVALEPTQVSDKAKIIAALDSLGAGGGTAGAEGIRTAYALAESSMRNYEMTPSAVDTAVKPAAAINRVILATDGDFNIGITDHNELKSFIERERASGVFLSVLGFGTGNYNDQMMQDLAQNGNGVAAYIDTLSEARKVLVQEASSTLFTIAKDVKIQVEFNPAMVSEYRLVGYETRALNKEDFNNDKVDAGDIGAGHAVTAIYDITPVGSAPSVDPSRYGDTTSGAPAKPEATALEYGFLKIRYKLPDGDTSKLITTAIPAGKEKALTLLSDQIAPADAPQPELADDDVRFSVVVAGFGQLLKGRKYTGKLTYDEVINMAQGAKGEDPFGYRAEFINLVRLAKSAQALPNTQQ